MYTVESFRKSKEWESFRNHLMIERTDDNGDLICEYCHQPILKRYDCIAHHKIELTNENVNDFTVSLNPDNILLIHHKCHNIIHQRFEGFHQRAYLVYGAPCSGKSTWVQSVANDDDLILDVDNIWSAICAADKYHKPARLKANVFGIRDCIVDQIRTRTGKWRNAYIIGGFPLRSDRERMCDLLNASAVYIESTLEECLSRAKTDEWEDFILEWFVTFTE